MPDLTCSNNIDTFMSGGVLALPDVGIRVGATTPVEMTGSEGALTIAARGTDKDIILDPSGKGCVKFPSVDGATCADLRVAFTHAGSQTWPASLVLGNGGTLLTHGLPNPIDPIDGMLDQLYEWNGTQNVIIGIDAGLANSSGNNNTFVGAAAGKVNSIGTQNTFIGCVAGFKATTSYHNTFIGAFAGWDHEEGHYNVMVGTDCGLYAKGGTHCTFVGSGAGQWNEPANVLDPGPPIVTDHHGDFNTYIGAVAGQQNRSGQTNTAVGFAALNACLTGTFNTVVGANSLALATVAHENTALGQGTLGAMTEGNYNVAIGLQALGTETISEGNVAVGHRALFDQRNNNTYYGHNTAIGYNTGRGIVTGTDNTIIGARVTGLAPGLSNNIIIADGTGNQRINVDGTGKVGMGIAAPTAALHVVTGTGVSMAQILHNPASPVASIYAMLKNAGAEWLYGIGYAGPTSKDFFIFDSQNGKVGLHLSEAIVDNGHNLILGNFDNRAARLQSTATTIMQIAAYYDPVNYMGIYVDSAGIATFTGSSGLGGAFAKIHLGHLTVVTDSTEATTAGVGALRCFGGIQAEKKIITATSMTTGSPAGTTPTAFRVGRALAVTPTSPNRTIELEIDGTIYYLHAKTTNN